MAAKPLKVMIIGAGVGGLCLAQGLRKAEIDVEVFDRDPTPAARARGFRLSLNAMGVKALANCLSPEAFARLNRDTARPSRTVSFLDHRLNRWLTIDLPRHDRASLDGERPIGRPVLRKALLHGLDDVARFDKKFVAFEETPDGRVVARFDDGSEAVADVLVGADGASSRVRRQLLPGAARLDSGVVAIGGKRLLAGAARERIPAPVFTGPTLILAPRGGFMFASAVVYDDLGAEAADREEYVLWGVSAPKARLPLGPDLDAVAPERLRAAALEVMEGWHETLRRIVVEADAASLSAFAIKSAVPIKPWPTRRVTLLGDSLHNMPPHQGVGANTALWAADALRRALTAAARGETPLLEALSTYEREAIDHGFRFVRRSLNATYRFHSPSPVRRALTKCMLRVLDKTPPLRALAFARR
jgi:2-polyprenyl-6-methoxyphenol hydroxylase-like FAD-dependent oxidoreductase